jgi:3-methyladenine DNA glycosylase AlkD
LTAREIKQRLSGFANSDLATLCQSFFKAFPGEYGEGDRFRGIGGSVIRKLAKEYQALNFTESQKLLCSSYHEDRRLALLILVHTFERGDDTVKKKVYNLYLKNARFINNWDLVDLSAPQILGGFHWGRSRDALYRLAQSRNLWRRRMAIMATLYFIRRRDFTDTLKMSAMLLLDREDLIHKAVGWMLREVGKRDQLAEERFLNKYCDRMPRVMLRYAIEKFPEPKRRQYLTREEGLGPREVSGTKSPRSG